MDGVTQDIIVVSRYEDPSEIRLSYTASTTYFSINFHVEASKEGMKMPQHRPIRTKPSPIQHPITFHSIEKRVNFTEVFHLLGTRFANETTKVCNVH